MQNLIVLVLGATFVLHHASAASIVTLNFSPNVTKLENGQPFTAKCEISNFEATGKDYKVQFMRLDGSLATFQIKPPAPNLPPQPIFIMTDRKDITTSPEQFAFPSFAVRFEPKSVKTDDQYYCSLVTGTGSSSVEYKSNKWMTNASLQSIPSVMLFTLAVLISLKYSVSN